MFPASDERDEGEKERGEREKDVPLPLKQDTGPAIAATKYCHFLYVLAKRKAERKKERGKEMKPPSADARYSLSEGTRQSRDPRSSTSPFPVAFWHLRFFTMIVDRKLRER